MRVRRRIYDILLNTEKVLEILKVPTCKDTESYFEILLAQSEI